MSWQQRRSPRNATSWRPVVAVVSKPPSPAPQRDPRSSCSGRPFQATSTRRAPPRSALAPSTSSSAAAASSSSPPPPRVYLQVTPLEGLSFLASGPAQLSPHAVVVLETFSHDSSRTTGEEGRQQQPKKNSQVFAFDFLPREPKRLSTALALFSGRPVEAIGRERRLSRVPRRRCVLVCEGKGEGSEEEGKEKPSLLAVARARCRAWEQTPLVWLRYDCTHAAVELAAELAGVEESEARRALVFAEHR